MAGFGEKPGVSLNLELKIQRFQYDLAEEVGFEPAIRFQVRTFFQGPGWQASAYNDVPLA